jgi:hypothetical protein
MTVCRGSSSASSVTDTRLVSMAPFSIGSTHQWSRSVTRRYPFGMRHADLAHPAPGTATQGLTKSAFVDTGVLEDELILAAEALRSLVVAGKGNSTGTPAIRGVCPRLLHDIPKYA